MAMKAKEDERKFILECFGVYRPLRALWNVKSKDYSNRIKKKTSSVYECTVEDVEYICNSNSTLCLFYFAIFVVLLLS